MIVNVGVLRTRNIVDVNIDAVMSQWCFVQLVLLSMHQLNDTTTKKTYIVA